MRVFLMGWGEGYSRGRGSCGKLDFEGWDGAMCLAAVYTVVTLLLVTS